MYQEIADILMSPDAASPAHMPGIADGLQGMEFINAAVRSSQADGKWVGI